MKQNGKRWGEFVKQMQESISRVDPMSPPASKTQAPGGNESAAGISGAGEKDREIQNPTSHDSPSRNLGEVSPTPFKNKFEESSDVARKAHKGASIEDKDQEVMSTPNLAPIPLSSALTALVPPNSSRNVHEPSTLLISCASVSLGIESKEQKFVNFRFVSIKPSQGYRDPMNCWGIDIREGQENNVKTPRQELESKFKNSEVIVCPLTVLVLKESKEMGDINHCYGDGVHGMEYGNEIFGLYSLKSFPFDGGGIVAHSIEVKTDGESRTIDAIKDTITMTGKLLHFVNSCCWCGAERMGLYWTSNGVLAFDPGGDRWFCFQEHEASNGSSHRTCC